MDTGDYDAPFEGGYDLSPGELVSEGIVRFVASLTGRDVVPGESAEALEPLCTVVDPEALDSLFGADGSSDGLTGGSVSFVYHGYEVTVTGDDRVTAGRLDR